MSDTLTWDEREAYQKKLAQSFTDDKGSYTLRVLKNRNNDPGGFTMNFNLDFLVVSSPAKAKSNV